jgi:hypothetical protein
VSAEAFLPSTDTVDALVGRTTHYQDLGLTVFDNVIPRRVLDQMNAAIDANKSTWPAPDGGDLPLAKSLSEMIRRTARFRALESQACEAARHWAAATAGLKYVEESLHVLRCVNRDMMWQSHLRHHDSHLLTLLIPLQLADPTERNGDLVLYKRRRQSVSFLGNMAYKTWLVIQQNRRFAARARQTRRDLSLGRCRRIACVPGNVYAFNGFLSLHANLEIDSGERRSLIIHHFDPCLTAGIKHVTRALHVPRKWLD